VKRSILLAPLGLALTVVLACGEQPPADTGPTSDGSESETGDPTGDGDGDPTGDGDGDGDPTGDGDGDPTGDGDGDPGPDYPLDDLLRLTDVQVKGTHNSYHVEPEFLFHPSHAYTHPPLDVQLADYGVRAFELDVHRHNTSLLVYHIFTADQVSTCESLGDCLSTIKGWSDQNPGHLPIMIWIELKDDAGGDAFVDLAPLDQAILAVFPPEQVLTPDLVRGEHPSLRAAIEADGWPTLGEVRDKVMFMILNGGHPAAVDYLAGEPALLGKLMFVGTDDFTAAHAAVSKINNPGSSRIADAHAAGILTASNTCGASQAEAECFAELEAGLASGTHALKDDFLVPGEGMTYFLDLPDGNPARCNAATAPPECTAAALENLR
jgi:hypothetical protein